MALELRQVEVRPGAVVEETARVVEEVQAEVEERASDGRPVDEEVLLVQMPAARAHDERRGLVPELIRLPLRTGEVDLAQGRQREVVLPLDQVAPRRRVRVLEI